MQFLTVYNQYLRYKNKIFINWCFCIVNLCSMRPEIEGKREM